MFAAWLCAMVALRYAVSSTACLHVRIQYHTGPEHERGKQRWTQHVPLGKDDMLRITGDIVCHSYFINGNIVYAPSITPEAIKMHKGKDSNVEFADVDESALEKEIAAKMQEAAASSDLAHEVLKKIAGGGKTTVAQDADDFVEIPMDPVKEPSGDEKNLQQGIRQSIMAMNLIGVPTKSPPHVAFPWPPFSEATVVSQPNNLLQHKSPRNRNRNRRNPLREKEPAYDSDNPPGKKKAVTGQSQQETQQPETPEPSIVPSEASTRVRQAAPSSKKKGKTKA
ncbi:hypothetical protein BKA57DRAFT_501460 [Linnemannia elongata]|nr:hypothetical protein BKA57DRAFT_501460 [Linnemannia elongata]